MGNLDANHPGRLPAESSRRQMDPSPALRLAETPRRNAHTRRHTALLFDRTRGRLMSLDERSSHARRHSPQVVVASSAGQGSSGSDRASDAPHEAGARASGSRMGNRALEAPGRGGGPSSSQAPRPGHRRPKQVDRAHSASVPENLTMTDRSGRTHQLCRRAGPRSGVPEPLRRSVNARAVMALVALGSLMAARRVPSRRAKEPQSGRWLPTRGRPQSDTWRGHGSSAETTASPCAEGEVCRAQPQARSA